MGSTNEKTTPGPKKSIVNTLLARIRTEVATLAIGDPCNLLVRDGESPIDYDDYCDQSSGKNVAIINGCIFVQIGADREVNVYREPNGDIRIAVSEE